MEWPELMQALRRVRQNRWTLTGIIVFLGVLFGVIVKIEESVSVAEFIWSYAQPIAAWTYMPHILIVANVLLFAKGVHDIVREIRAEREASKRALEEHQRVIKEETYTLVKEAAGAFRKESEPFFLSTQAMAECIVEQNKREQLEKLKDKIGTLHERICKITEAIAAGKTSRENEKLYDLMRTFDESCYSVFEFTGNTEKSSEFRELRNEDVQRIKLPEGIDFEEASAREYRQQQAKYNKIMRAIDRFMEQAENRRKKAENRAVVQALAKPR